MEANTPLTLPDNFFLCIGAPKSGSTWLFKNLQAHPDIWVPPFKSIKYFSNELHTGVRRKKFKKNFPSAISSLSYEELLWSAKYFLQPRPSFSWYRSLLPDYPAVGEVAPSYTTLNEQQVQYLSQCAPHAKIIFLMRNPIERIWSHTQMKLFKHEGRTFEETPRERFYEEFDRGRVARRTRYTDVLNTWQTFFPPDQFFIGFYEEVNEHPYAFLERLCHFLEVRYDTHFFSERAENKSYNRGSGIPIPEHFAAYLAAQYRDELCELHERFGRYATTWKNEIDRIESRGQK